MSGVVSLCYSIETSVLEPTQKALLHHLLVELVREEVRKPLEARDWQPTDRASVLVLVASRVVIFGRGEPVSGGRRGSEYLAVASQYLGGDRIVVGVGLRSGGKPVSGESDVGGK